MLLHRTETLKPSVEHQGTRSANALLEKMRNTCWELEITGQTGTVVYVAHGSKVSF